MGIRRGQAHEHAFDRAGLIVSVRSADEPKIGSLHEQNAVSEKLKTRWAVEIIDEVGELIGFAVTVSIFENNEAVAGFAGGSALGIIGPNSNPEPAPGIPGHWDWLGEFGKFFLAREEVHLHAGMNLHFRKGIFSAEELK